MTSKLLRSNQFIVLLSFLAGAILPLGLAPFDLWWLTLLSVGSFPLLLGSSNGFWRGWAYGSGVFTAGVSWVYVSLANYSSAGPVGASLATLALGVSLGLFFAVLGVIHQLLPKKFRHPLISSALWVGCEWLRSWIFTGFPWLYVGYTGLTAPLVNHLIPIIGIYGCSFLLSLWGMIGVKLIWSRLEHRRPSRFSWSFLSILIALPLINLAFSQQQWIQQVEEKPLRLALIQGNIDQRDKWDRDKAPRIEQYYLNTTALALQDNVDLVVWPEAALPYLYTNGLNTLAHARTLLQAAPQKPTLITGVLTDNQQGALPQLPVTRNDISDEDFDAVVRNSVLLLSQNTVNDRLYHKQQLVPFGEYLPFAEQLIKVMPFLGAFRHGIHRGPSEQTVFTTQDWSLQPLICYEIAFPALAFNEMRSEPRLPDALLTVSNDGWFGLSHGPAQHFQMAQFRAKEFGRPVIRVTNTGITGVIAPNGSTLASLPRQQSLTLFYDLPKVTGTTPYSNIGPNIILLFVMLASLLCFAWIAIRSRK